MNKNDYAHDRAPDCPQCDTDVLVRRAAGPRTHWVCDHCDGRWLGVDDE